MYMRLLTVVCVFLLAVPGNCFNSGWSGKIASMLESRGKGGGVKSFYEKQQYKPVWITDNGWTTAAKQALTLLQQADREGLNPKDYQTAITTAQSAEESPEAAARAEIELTRQFLQYIDDVRNGRFNPKLADRQLVMKPDPVNPVELLSQGIAQGPENTTWMMDLPPHYDQYKRLRALLQTFAGRVQEQEVLQIPKGTVLKFEESSPHVLTLRVMLRRKGDLLENNDRGGTTFDEDLELAVKIFQKRHDLEVDGVIGPQTLGVLNKTPRDHVKQIIISMERWRWMPRDPGQRYIQVNIAGFELFAVENNQVQLTSPIIVGLAYRETPVFTAPMTDIKFNPSWHVPFSIATRDKLPKIRRDPSYLTRKGYVLYNSAGQRISPHSVNWGGVSRGNWRYKLRQTPGSHNALGKIRFTIKNNFRVFLHSTPDVHLFEKSVRTFSSGCIRVKKVEQLAAFVLNNPSEWPLTRVQNAMAGNKTNRVYLKQNLPTHITYFTVWVGDDGTARFFDDVYGQDQQIWDALRKQRAV
ncbi:MAG: L,D-transpeptidase family protein [Alphaproteobacteria bacterium]